MIRAAGVAVLALLLSSCSEPPPRDVPVGRLHRSYTDAARLAWDGQGPRPLAATIWYPAAADSIEQPWQIDVFEFGRNAPDAAFADGKPRPLILLSHGTGGSAAQLSWLAEALASAGFVVAAVNHHGNTAAEPAYQPHGFVLPWERARDLSVLLDQLLIDRELAVRIDPQRIGAAGFSLGGYSVLATAGARLTPELHQRHCTEQPQSPACRLPPEAPFTTAEVDRLRAEDAQFQAGLQRAEDATLDPRIDALYAIAPALLPALDDDSLRAISVPLKIVLGEYDDQVPPGDTAARAAALLPQAQIERRTDAAHYSFLASCSWRGRWFVKPLCSDPAGVDRQQLHAEVAQDAVRFFSAQLRR